jgi:hypothetical protein
MSDEYDTPWRVVLADDRAADERPPDEDPLLAYRPCGWGASPVANRLAEHAASDDAGDGHE